MRRLLALIALCFPAVAAPGDWNLSERMEKPGWEKFVAEVTGNCGVGRGCNVNCIRATSSTTGLSVPQNAWIALDGSSCGTTPGVGIRYDGSGIALMQGGTTMDIGVIAGPVLTIGGGSGIVQASEFEVNSIGAWFNGGGLPILEALTPNTPLLVKGNQTTGPALQLGSLSTLTSGNVVSFYKDNISTLVAALAFTGYFSTQGLTLPTDEPFATQPTNPLAYLSPISRIGGWCGLPNNSATTFSCVFLQTPTQATTPSNGDTFGSSPNRLALTYATGTTANTIAGINGPYTSTEARMGPALYAMVGTGSSLLTQRIYVGLSSADLTGADTNNATNFCALRLSSTASDTTFQCCESDGATQACSATATVVATSTNYVLGVDLSSLTSCKCTVSTGANLTGLATATDVVTISSHNPTSSAALGAEIAIKNTTTTTEGFSLARFVEDEF